jgi:ribonuclease MRP protein subunit RMP1
MAAHIAHQLQNEKTSKELADLSKLLHLLHHRSKNQHRRSVWYRHFNTMRRHHQQLQAEISPELPASWPPSRKRKRKEECDERVEQRLNFWAEVLVPKWFAAFSQVVADKRFAALGLVLCAALARLCKITGVLERIEESADEDMRGALSKFAFVETGQALLGFDEHMNEMEVAGEESDDVGIVIERGDIEENPEPAIGTGKDEWERVHRQVSHGLEEDAVPPKTTERSKRKKGRKGDAIDDIFAGLS